MLPSGRALADGVLFLNPTRADLLVELRMSTVGRAFEDDFAQVLRSLPSRENAVRRSSAGLLFVKRHQRGRGKPQGQLEWEVSWTLRRHGIAVAEPICAGVDRRGRSFLITLGIEGEPLDDFLRRGRPATDLFSELLLELADLSARLHGQGFCHRDYYLCHVFVRPKQPAGSRLVLIDLQRVMTTGKFRRTRWRQKDLGALAYSSMGLPITDRDRMRFLSLYRRKLRASPGRSARRERRKTRSELRSVSRRARALLSRHGVPVAPAARDYGEPGSRNSAC